MKLSFRPPRDDADRTFAVETWLESQRTSYSAGLVRMHRWFDVMRPEIEAHLARPGMQTLVAFERTDPAFLYGWIAADPTEQRVPGKGGSVRWWPALVLYVFVKATFRREGIARALFEAVGIDPAKPFLYSCNTVMASRLASKTPQAKFDPLVCRFPSNLDSKGNPT